jgi:hypothetical protein
MEATPSIMKANLALSFTAICTSQSFIILPWQSATNLQNKSDSGPGECSMGWIILHSDISDLLEKVNPLNKLVKEVSEDDRLVGLPSITPPLLDTLLFGCFREFMQVC